MAHPKNPKKPSNSPAPEKRKASTSILGPLRLRPQTSAPPRNDGRGKRAQKRRTRLSFFRAEHPSKVKLHKSFKRSYREDYIRPLKAPGLLNHAMTTLGFIFKNWKLFGTLALAVIIANIFLVGLMQEENYVTFQETLDETNEYLVGGQLSQMAKAGLLLISTITTGGLSQGTSEVQLFFAILLFIITWLVTIYLIRHLMAGNKPKMRDGLYNALSPLVSTVLVALVVFFHLIPIFAVIITLNFAQVTDFLSTPLHAFIYWLFAAGLTLLSFYLLPSSLLGLVSVSAPGMYPLTAIRTASDLMAGRRTKFILRLLFALFFLAVIWAVIMLPIILIDFAIKGGLEWTTGIPIVPFFLQLMTTFTFIYFTAYIYMFYRRLLDDPN